MRIKVHKWAIYLVWPHGDDVPDWAWHLAHKKHFRIGCYGGYENCLVIGQ